MTTSTIRQFQEKLAEFIDVFIYVDCGARGEITKSIFGLIKHGQYLGFEPDADECKRLNDAAIPGHTFFPVALGRMLEERDFYVTGNPSCSSLMAPKSDSLDPYEHCDGFLDVKKVIRIQTQPLDDYLNQQGFNQVDYLELDTQGSELEILEGSTNFLTQTILAVQVEVEFVPQYLDQPLFGDVDAFMRSLGFALFDISPRTLKWKGCPAGADTKSQLLWGHALYFKSLLEIKPGLASFISMAAIASFHGFHDYALAVLQYGSSLESHFAEQSDILSELHRCYANALESNHAPSSLNSTGELNLLRRFIRLLRS